MSEVDCVHTFSSTSTWNGWKTVHKKVGRNEIVCVWDSGASERAKYMRTNIHENMQPCNAYKATKHFNGTMSNMLRNDLSAKKSPCRTYTRKLLYTFLQERHVEWKWGWERDSIFRYGLCVFAAIIMAFLFSLKYFPVLLLTHAHGLCFFVVGVVVIVVVFRLQQLHICIYWKTWCFDKLELMLQATK